MSHGSIGTVIPDALLREVERGDLILVVGDGLHAPGWRELAQVSRDKSIETGLAAAELAEVDRLIDGGDKMGAFTELERHLGPAQLGLTIADALGQLYSSRVSLRPLPKEVQALVGLIPKLRAVITTKIDACVPLAVPQDWIRYQAPTGNLAQRHHYILQMYGDVHKRKTWTLTRQDHDRIWERTTILTDYIRAVCMAQCLLFVGFELDDPDLQRFATPTLRALGLGQPPHHFALVNSEVLTPSKQRAWWESGIELIGYHKDDGPQKALRSIVTKSETMCSPEESEPMDGFTVTSSRLGWWKRLRDALVAAAKPLRLGGTSNTHHSKGAYQGQEDGSKKIHSWALGHLFQTKTAPQPPEAKIENSMAGGSAIARSVGNSVIRDTIANKDIKAEAGISFHGKSK